MNDRILRALALTVAMVGACGGEENRPATWSYISPAIIQPNCATSSCHSRGAAVAGLDLSEVKGGFDSLMKQKLPTTSVGGIDRKGHPEGVPPRQLVAPGNPTQSRLMNMLRGIGANRMPPDRPLAEADVDLVEAWILKGANND